MPSHLPFMYHSGVETSNVFDSRKICDANWVSASREAMYSEGN